MRDYYKNKIFLGELNLGDLWDMGLLEGMMQLNDLERTTAGKRGEKIEFCGPKVTTLSFPASSKVKLNSSFQPRCAVDFEGNTLILSRGIDLIKED